MPESATVVPIKPRAVSKRRHSFPKPIDKALCEYQARVSEALATLKLLEQHVSAPPFGELDYGIVSGAVDAAIRLLKPVKGLDQPLELEQLGKALALENANG